MSIENMNDGGPAFPALWSADNNGMSLLDYFAGQVAGAIHSSSRLMIEYDLVRERTGPSVEHMIAVDAYDQAEEMLFERERRMKK